MEVLSVKLEVSNCMNICDKLCIENEISNVLFISFVNTFFVADDRFIIKEMSRLEMQIFLEFAPNYFSYMEKCQQTKQPTLLGKIVGVYRVSFKNNTTNAALRTSVLVMENLFYKRAITDKFDLKGSVRNRLVNPDDMCHEGELVLLDENLLNSKRYIIYNY